MNDNLILCDAQHLHLRYNGGPFSSGGLTVTLAAAGGARPPWRWGMELHPIGGTARTLDGADGEILLQDSLFSWEGCAVLDDSRAMALTPDGWLAPHAPGQDIYFFGYDRDFEAGVAGFYRLCGPQPLLPRYALGCWWSRFHRYTQAEYLALMERFCAEKLPFTVAVVDMDWHLVDIDPALGTGWTLLELYIPATNEPVDDIIATLEVAPGTGVLYADSRGLYPTDLPAPAGSASAGEEESDGALLKNGGVEQLNPDGTVTHWDVWPGNPEEGQRNSYSTTEFKHSGERSVCIELVYSNPQAIYQYRLPEDNAFDFNADYIFSAWVKMDGVSVLDGNGVKIGVKRKGADGNEYNVYQSVPMGTCDRTKVELEVPKEPGVNIVQYDVIFDIGCGTGKIYFDDFELTPAELTAAGPEFAFREVEFTAADLLPAAGAASGFAARDIALLGASGVCLIVAAALGGTATIRFKKRRNG